MYTMVSISNGIIFPLLESFFELWGFTSIYALHKTHYVGDFLVEEKG